jgi:hypothetical protein
MQQFAGRIVAWKSYRMELIFAQHTTAKKNQPNRTHMGKMIKQNPSISSPAPDDQQKLINIITIT